MQLAGEQSGRYRLLRLRADFQNFRYYYFSMCEDGSYQLLRFIRQNTSTSLLQQASSPFIHTGLNQVNTIAVVANGSFSFH
jgi:hypothetical protein